MKYVIARAGTDDVFDEIDFSALRVKSGGDEVEGLGAFARVTLAENGSVFFVGALEREGGSAGERRFSVACALGNLDFSVERASRMRSAAAQRTSAKIVKSSMPGRVVRVLCGIGDAVTVGQPLLVLEAMKMENEICAPIAGKIEQMDVVQGKKVETGEALLKIAP